MLTVNPTGKHRKKRRHHGDGTVFLRRDHWRRSAWVAVVPYTDESGRSRKMSRSASSEAEAEAMRAELVAKLRAGVPGRAFAETLGDYLAAWMDEQREHLAPGSWDRYRQHLEQRILPTLGTVALADLSVAMIRDAASRWEGGPSTRSGTVTVLKVALRDAGRDGLLTDNPARYLRAPSVRHAPRPALDVEDARRLLATARPDRLYPVLVVTLGLALRRGEALGLRTGDLDLDAGTVRIVHSLRRIPVPFRAEKEAALRLVAPKHGSYRTLPLPDFVADALRVRLAALAAERAAAKVWAPNDLVFCNPDGTAIALSRLARWFEALVSRAGLPPMRWHDLRGSAATMLLAEGVDVRVVQAILGHRTVQQTAEYAKVLPRVSRDATDRLGRALG